jgi:CheY-like chemotaxis protein
MIQPGCQVLVVDDDPDIRESLRFCLEEAGYPVAEAADGSSALRLLTQSVGHWVILLDRMMPQMDGIAVLRNLASVPEVKARTATIFMSARSDPPDAEAARIVKDHAHTTISKPFDLDVLLAAVERACPRLADIHAPMTEPHRGEPRDG